MTMWKPGMRCVCVRECEPDRNAVLLSASYPRKGEVVTIRDTTTWKDMRLLRFVEHRNPKFRWDREPGFNSAWFRPLSETRLDQFRQHLAPKPKVEERV